MTAVGRRVFPVQGRPLPLRRRVQLAGEILTVYRRARRLMHSVNLAEALAALRQVDPAVPAGATPDQQRFAAVRLGRAVVLVLALLPTDRRCLVRSLVLSCLLARRGIPALLVLGVRPDGDQPFVAHAWVEYDGQAVTPDEGYNRLHAL